MTDEELIKTLWSGEVTLGVVASAATRIEQLAIENYQLIASLEVCNFAWDQAFHQRDEAEAKLAECLEQNALLEARLGKAMEVLCNTDKVLPKISGLWFDCTPRKEILATLTELEKDT